MTAAEVGKTGEILDAAKAAAVDVAALEKRVEAVLRQPLHWFPVRHHSPTIARQVARCVRERRPKIVFIEGPAEAQAMVEFVTDAKTRPPVAIYSSFQHEAPPAPAAPPTPVTPGGPPGPALPPPGPPRHAAWFPLVTYSPEYQAMLAAKEIGAKVVFIDLPHYALTVQDEAEEDDDAETGDEAAMPPPTPNPAAATPDNAPAESPRPGPPGLEALAARSDFYRVLAQAAGHRSFDETWDRLFETPRAEDTPESVRRDVALFCAAMRATTPRAALEYDGTLARERFMWRTIRDTLAQSRVSAGEAMVVCGGFHLFMDQDDPTPPPAIPAGNLSVTVAPYSYVRISQLLGYGAGNRAPRFYELCFEKQTEGSGQGQVVIEHVVNVIAEARSQGEPLSPADAIGATQAATLLARLRGRHEPVLDDIHDAILTCCCKGNPRTDAGPLLLAMDEVSIGTRLGKVTERIGRLPVVKDFYEQMERLGLGEVIEQERLRTYTLDKRQPLDHARSAFLHRLIFLETEIGQVQREAAPFGQSIFKEQWRLRWSPKVEAALIEHNLLGDTIEAAAATRLRESLGAAAGEAGPACRRLVQAVDMDLPQLVTDAERSTGHAIDHDGRFASLADALSSLMLLERYATYRGLAPERLAGLIARCFDRACFAIPGVASVPPESWVEVVAGLHALAEPAVRRDDLDVELFAGHVRQAARESTVPFLRGAFLGVLTELKRMPAQELADELTAYARGGADRQAVAGDFLHGVLRVSRTAILLGARPLVKAIDELLRVAEPETFLVMVPRLRAAFEALHARQRDGLAQHVAELYGMKESQSLRTLSTSVGAAQLLAELDAQVARIMGEWIEGRPGGPSDAKGATP